MHQRASAVDSEFSADVTLRGTPDRVFSTAPGQPGGELTIIDFETSAFTDGQEEGAMLPFYKVQLGGYGYIAEALGWGRVKRLALIYWEPKQEVRGTLVRQRDSRQTDWQSVPFALEFLPLVNEVALDFRQLVPKLVAEATRLLLAPRPEPRLGCKNCVKTDEFIRRAQVEHARHPEAA